MKDLADKLRKSLRDPEYAESYADSFLDLYLATQLKVLREQREMTQGELGDLIGTTQGGVSRIENANYSGWTVNTLKKLARALRVRLRISFEEFGTLPDQLIGMDGNSLERAAHESDPLLFPEKTKSTRPGKVTNIEEFQRNQQYKGGPNAGSSEVDSLNPLPVSARGLNIPENTYGIRK